MQQKDGTQQEDGTEQRDGTQQVKRLVGAIICNVSDLYSIRFKIIDCRQDPLLRSRTYTPACRRNCPDNTHALLVVHHLFVPCHLFVACHLFVTCHLVVALHMIAPTKRLTCCVPSNCCVPSCCCITYDCSYQTFYLLRAILLLHYI